MSYENSGRPSNSSRYSTSTLSTASSKTIALFGAESKTGSHFLQLALDAGYQVRALTLEETPSEQTNVRWVPTETYLNPKAIKTTVKGADFVVCMLNDIVLDLAAQEENQQPHRRVSVASSKGSNNNNNKNAGSFTKAKPVTSFLKLLYPILKKEPAVRVILYQVRWKILLACDNRSLLIH